MDEAKTIKPFIKNLEGFKVRLEFLKDLQSMRILKALSNKSFTGNLRWKAYLKKIWENGFSNGMKIINIHRKLKNLREL